VELQHNCRLVQGKLVVGIAIAGLALQVTSLTGCSQRPIECPDAGAEIPDLTLSKAKSLVGTTVSVCTTSSAGTANEPVQREIVEPWDALLAVDGTQLPAPVRLPGGGRPAECRVETSTQTYLYADGRWLRARTVGCAQLD